MIANTITLRPAAPEDAGAVADLLVQLYHTEAPGVLRGARSGQAQLLQHVLANELSAGGGRYVAANSGTIVGSASLRRASGPADAALPPGSLRVAIATIGLGDTLRLVLSALRASLTSDVSLRPGECYIYSVVVDEPARGRGVGAAMMTQIEGAARHLGARSALLRVVVGNEPARRLYLRLGYRVVSRTPPILDRVALPTELMRKEL
ncbi:GNAT family N-acetyltransferase [Oscillochloris sp. ZM17-4]|uniref:GNAT family N-acetyltransferase n=1 Tax=Oscillochloris sp. ZM17-4 TaxID=2866714 RepID=UPI001C72D3B8|nr:GNAT family N-acetyltransferase [Oscillochloris sp. ZM17-4]MBX0329878.1 GNAT family N-acetyltransferase [Oscillochloris sp. ZM17-4]